MENGIVIIGAGHAGAQAALALRQEGYSGPVTLIGRESEVPYHRPPLSKTFLKEEHDRSMPLKAEAFYQSQGIGLLLGGNVVSLDLGNRSVLLDDGSRIGFSKLILATGATPRTPPIPGIDLEGVLSLRTIEDARHIRALLPGVREAVVIGGGFIGLEIASTLALLGKRVTVLEIANRVLGRAVSPIVSDHVMTRLSSQGVAIKLGSGATAIEGGNGGVVAVTTTAGERIPANLVIHGVGVDPDCALAENAGIVCRDGILVDETLTTSHPDILAVGDCARFDHWHAKRSVRLESVQNATDQARIAARTIMGKAEAYRAVPWFWSDIGDMKLQMVGLSFETDTHIVSGNRSDNAFSVYHYSGGRLIAIDSINKPADHMLGRRILAAGFSPSVEDVKTNRVKEAFAAFSKDLSGEEDHSARRQPIR